MINTLFLLLLALPLQLLAIPPDPCTGEVVRDSVYISIIDPCLHPFRFHFIARDKPCYRLIIMTNDSQDTLQVIEDYPFANFSFEDDETERAIQFIDANFDGYTDLKIFDNRGITTNVSYKFWIYNKNKKTFEFDEALTQLLGTNPNIDPRTKTFRTGEVVGCVGMCYYWETYQFINGKPVLIEREQQKILNSGDKTNNRVVFVRILERLIDGKMTITKKIQGSLEEIDEKWEKR